MTNQQQTEDFIKRVMHKLFQLEEVKDYFSTDAYSKLLELEKEQLVEDALLIFAKYYFMDKEN